MEAKWIRWGNKEDSLSESAPLVRRRRGTPRADQRCPGHENRRLPRTVTTEGGRKRVSQHGKQKHRGDLKRAWAGRGTETERPRKT